jgi:cytochrome P450
MPATLTFLRWRGDPLAGMLHPRTMVDPYPLWSELRARDLYRSKIGYWGTARHATAASILRDLRFSASPVHQKGYRVITEVQDPEASAPGAELSLLSMDPPDHTRIRRLVAGAFSPKTLGALETWVRRRTLQLLDAVESSETFDLIDALAYPLPMGVICQLLGVPPEDQDRFRRWGREIVTNLEPSIDGTPSAEGLAADRALQAYFTDLIAKRRADPDESLLSNLIAAEEEGDRLSFEELMSTCILLLVAGFETTVNLIGNGTMALIGAPEEWARLSGHPELVPGAVEELLRYDSPVQATSRVATEDIELEGKVVAKGESVIIALGGANRDPEAFIDPDRLDVTRPDANRHLSFSLGIHHCLGAMLARMEGRIAFEELTSRFAGMTVAAPPRRRDLLILRGFDSLPVRPVRSAG